MKKHYRVASKDGKYKSGIFDSLKEAVSFIKKRKEKTYKNLQIHEFIHIEEGEKVPHFKTKVHGKPYYKNGVVDWGNLK